MVPMVKITQVKSPIARPDIAGADPDRAWA